MKHQLPKHDERQRKDAKTSIGKWKKNEKRCDKTFVIRFFTYCLFRDLLFEMELGTE